MTGSHVAEEQGNVADSGTGRVMTKNSGTLAKVRGFLWRSLGAAVRLVNLLGSLLVELWHTIRWLACNFLSWFIAGLLVLLVAIRRGLDMPSAVTAGAAVWAVGALWYEYLQYAAGHQRPSMFLWFHIEGRKETYLDFNGQPVRFGLIVENRGRRLVKHAAVDVRFQAPWDVQPVRGDNSSQPYSVSCDVERNQPVVRFTAHSFILHPHRSVVLPQFVLSSKQPVLGMEDSIVFVEASCEGMEWTPIGVLMIRVPLGDLGDLALGE